jgi:hypothetical protein
MIASVRISGALRQVRPSPFSRWIIVIGIIVAMTSEQMLAYPHVQLQRQLSHTPLFSNFSFTNITTRHFSTNFVVWGARHELMNHLMVDPHFTSAHKPALQNPGIVSSASTRHTRQL